MGCGIYWIVAKIGFFHFIELEKGAFQNVAGWWLNQPLLRIKSVAMI